MQSVSLCSLLLRHTYKAKLPELAIEIKITVLAVDINLVQGCKVSHNSAMLLGSNSCDCILVIPTWHA